MLSEATQSVWAKTDKSGQGGWLPLHQHLADAGAVAGHLWDNWLPVSVRVAITEQLELTDSDCRSLAVFLACTHDIGKATPDFARQAEFTQPELLTRMSRHGLKLPASRPERLGHQVTGQRLLRDWLSARYSVLPPKADLAAAVIGGHHGVNPTLLMLQAVSAYPDLLGDEPWIEVREELLEEALLTSGADEALATLLPTKRLTTSVQILLTGLVIVADWIASNEELFPYRDVRPTAERLRFAMTELDLPNPWQPALPAGDATDLLRRRFSSLAEVDARPIQRSLYEAARRSNAPGLYIVEDAMGGGKTEAALLCAELLAAKFGLGGIFFGLPTMATSNPMFTRVLAWLQTALGADDASVALVHSKAALNEEFSGLIAREWRGEVYDGTNSDHGQAVVRAWLLGRKRSALSAFVVGTIDQALFAALKAKHLVLRHLGLAGKVVIVDEVHAADDYMRAYLKSALAWLGAHRTPVILTSATLPPDQRDEFVRAYAQGAGDRRHHLTDRSDAYPRITAYTGELEHLQVPGEAQGRDIELIRIGDEPSELLARLSALLRDGGCAGVICNTVARAQESYRELRRVFGADVVLCHSRFIATDRQQREAEIVRRLGPDSDQRPDRLIVVGTQVLEQSLDIDFDVLVTDLAPVDLLLQRAGRLHRHPRQRPLLLEAARLVLRGVDDWSATPVVAVRGSKMIYGGDRLLRSAAVLADRERLQLPSDIPSLVRRAYDPELPPPVGWEEQWVAESNKAATKRASSVAKASLFLLSEPRSYSSMNGLVEVAAHDPEDTAAQGKSQVRDSEDGLEVLALFRDEAGTLRVPDTAPSFAGELVPTNLEWVVTDEPLAKAMTACTLQLPAVLCLPEKIDQVIHELEGQGFVAGWQSSRWLRGQLPVVFDTRGDVTLAGYQLHYDQELGLAFQEMEKTQ